MQFGPFESSAIEGFATRASWDAAAAELLAHTVARWQLTLGEAFVGGASGAVFRVACADGSPAVLKVGYPHVEAIWEAVGLEAAGPSLAPAVLRQDTWTWSLLLDDVSPGTPLSRSNLAVAEALRVGGELARRWHSCDVPAGIPTLHSAMQDYVEQVRGRLASQQAALRALDVLDVLESIHDLVGELLASSQSAVLLHGDLNPGNILFDQSHGRWLTVDAKPLVGDAAFDLWPLASQLGTDRRSGIELSARAAGVDAQRAVAWGFARSAINVSWYLADGMPNQAASEAAALKQWAGLLRR